MRTPAMLLLSLSTFITAGISAPLPTTLNREPPSSRACTPQVGPSQVVATAAQRAAAGAIAQPPITDKADGFAWPDTPLGVLRSAAGDLFFGSDGGRHARQIYHGHPYGNGTYGSATRTIGTLDDPLGISARRVATSPPLDVSIGQNADPTVNPNYATYDYIGGGPVYRVPAGQPGAGNLLMIYHAEIPTPGTHSFYSVLGLAASPNDGETWTDLGEILRVNQPYKPNLDGFDIGDPPLVVSNDGVFFSIYFRDWIANGTTHWGNSLTLVSVARVSINTLFATAFGSRNGRAAAFAKYYRGAWNEPGIGGRSTDLNPNAGYSGELQVAYDPALARYLMIVDAGLIIALSESTDGFHWTIPTVLRNLSASPDKPNTYSMPVGTGTDPHLLGKSFAVYYTRYPTNGGGWSAATVERFTVACQ